MCVCWGFVGMEGKEFARVDEMDGWVSRVIREGKQSKAQAQAPGILAKEGHTTTHRQTHPQPRTCAHTAVLLDADAAPGCLLTTPAAEAEGVAPLPPHTKPCTTCMNCDF